MLNLLLIKMADLRNVIIFHLLKLEKALKSTGSIILRSHSRGRSINFYNLIDYIEKVKYGIWSLNNV